ALAEARPDHLGDFWGAEPGEVVRALALGPLLRRFPRLVGLVGVDVEDANDVQRFVGHAALLSLGTGKRWWERTDVLRRRLSQRTNGASVPEEKAGDKRRVPRPARSAWARRARRLRWRAPPVFVLARQESEGNKAVMVPLASSSMNQSGSILSG